MTTEQTGIHLPSTTPQSRDRRQVRVANRPFRPRQRLCPVRPLDHDARAARCDRHTPPPAGHQRRDACACRVELRQSLLDQPVPELADIPPELDLISSPDQDVERGLAALVSLCRRIASPRYVTEWP